MGIFHVVKHRIVSVKLSSDPISYCSKISNSSPHAYQISFKFLSLAFKALYDLLQCALSPISSIPWTLPQHIFLPLGISIA